MIEQKMIPRSVWYGLDGKSYDSIAQELNSENPTSRKWAAIYAIYKYEFAPSDPFRHYDFINDAKNSRYATIIFSIPIETLETSDGLDDRHINIESFEEMNSEEEINSYLKKNQINPELFTPPWRCNYPL
ncbi:hypothetical protein G3495_15445 [Shewanella baltica]|uniref:hypothetical protein n=1 Tax=Shewanella baltica TaxID=62322 RepID=UPI00217F1AF4|nr:hypothetical protein [Shewanella baltica]MCS6236500.1 hypothetical protein [Shewanella baltica]MCS6270854.1 hypothetical protein [Shewanella baltica]